MKRILMLIVVIGLLTACSIEHFTAKGHWVKSADQMDEQYWNDRNECLAYSDSASKYFLAAWSPKIERGHFNNCMRAKGYAWETY